MRATGGAADEAAVLGAIGEPRAVPDAPSSSPEWLYEPKLDGYRVLAFVQNDKVRLVSRRGLDLTPFFPEIVADLAAQAVDTMIVDGEVVAL